jgi:cell wall-associated NlpC family hydrolase
MIKVDHLVGIPFEHGKDDCYEILRKFFKDNFSLELTNYARPEFWWRHGLNLYMDNFHAEGFRVADISLSDVRIGDVFLMAIQSEMPCHAAVYVGDGCILHHYYGRLSTVEAYRGIWRDTTTAIIRHKDVPKVVEAAKTVDLMSLLPQNRQRKYREALNATAPEQV